MKFKLVEDVREDINEENDEDIFDIFCKLYPDYLDIDTDQIFEDSVDVTVIKGSSRDKYFDPDVYEVDGYDTYVQDMFEEAKYIIEDTTKMKMSPSDDEYLMKNLSDFVDDFLDEESYDDRAIENYND